MTASPSVSSRVPRSPLEIALWATQIVCALFFVMAAFNKLSGHPMMVTMFKQIGVGQWFRYVTGLIELGAAILLVLPRYCGVGALLLVPTMLGAILTHLLIIGGRPLVPAVLLALMALVAYHRLGTIRALVASRAGKPPSAL